MSKPRRLAEIRARAAEETAQLKADIEAREDFTLPRPKSWRDEILRLIAQGKTLQDLAAAVGVSRSGLRNARKIDPAFAAAFDAAHRKGLRARFSKEKRSNMAKQLNDKPQRFNDENASRDRIHCELGSAKLIRHRRALLAETAPVALAPSWQKSLIYQPSGRMARAL
jgi:hypothetical protein